MNDDLAPAIALFERIISEAERKAAEARNSINALLQARGLPPRYGEESRAVAGTFVLSGTSTLSGSDVLSGAPPQIRRDTFYGKKQMTAIRELLEMRRASGQEGPATPREVVDGLKVGGYRFNTKSDDIALINVRALMRKATTVFHKLPGTNAYGLTSWYPNARVVKSGDDLFIESTPVRKRARKNQRVKGRTLKPRPRSNPTLPGNPADLAFVESSLADGSEWTTDRLMEAAASKGISGLTKRRLQGLLLNLKSRKRAVSLGGGVWRAAASPETPPTHDRVVPMKGFG
jgi:hypothetical protein